jgi:hypothetical protein
LGLAENRKEGLIMRKAIRHVAVASLAIMLALLLGGCFGIPKNTSKNVAVGTTKIEAVGAGIVKADAKEITYKIKCAVCGFEDQPKTIETPTAGKPYTIVWVCPECGHKQTITIKLAAQ